MKSRSALRSRAAGTVAIGAAAMAIGWLTFGGPGLSVAIVGTYLSAAIRHDNDLGTCFPVALLFLVLLAILALVVVMMSMLAPR